jgi:cyclase
MVLSIEAKRIAPGRWEVYTDCGREGSNVDAVEWARRGVELGAGEVLVTSIDREGTRKGFDLELTRAIVDAVNVPVIASGGFGEASHLSEVVNCGADAVAFADALHYNRATIPGLRELARESGIVVREVA